MFLLHPNLGCGSHFSIELSNLKTNVSPFQLPKLKAFPAKMLMGLLLFLGISLFQTTVLAQNANKPVTGKVLGANNQPLEGVTISQKGASKMALTDKEGKFSISVPSNATLVFSYVGYVAKQESVNNRTEINLSLVQENAVPDEVVVIGYQTIKRKNLLASVSSVSAKDLKDIPVNSAAEALNGRLAGVTATTAEGSPDADVRVRIRGGMSITGDNSPLYIVDGVQVENGLSALAPQNIQTIDVLKDAAATAIYGARGANGVIVITTKSGRQGKMTLSYNGFVGVKSLAKKLGVLSPYDYVIYQSERSRGSSTDSTTFTKNFGTTWDTLANYKNVNPIDWQDEIAGRTGVLQTHSLNASGGNKKITYNFGYTFNGDKAILLNSDYKRHLLNLKADYRITNNLRATLSTRYTNTNVLGAGVSSEQGSSYNRLRNAVKYRPFLSNNQDIDDADPLADPNVGNGLNLVNPISLANAEYRKKTTDVFNITASIQYTIAKNLSFKSTFGYDDSKLIDRQFSDSITPYSVIQGSRKPIAQLDTVTKKTITNSNVLTYSISKFKGKHDFDFLVGEETYDLKTESHTQLVRNYPTFTSPNDAFDKLGLGIPFTGYPKLGKTRYTNLSFFSRINYTYDNKYYFSFNVRADGASKFAPGKQWGYFPAGSFAWRVKNEKFMENVRFISDLKFRASYGNVGNNRINDYLFLTTFRNDGTYYYGINNQAVTAYYSAGLVNEALQWESNESQNYGMDLGLFKDRVSLSVDVYNNNAKNLLLNVPIASTYGYATQLQNIGKTSNKGVEFQLNALVIKKADFTWNSNFNMAFNKNKVEALGLNQTLFYPAASWGVSGQPTDYIIRIGDPVGSMWGLVNDGFYKVSDFDYDAATSVYTLKAGTVNNSGIIGTIQPGSVKFKDLDGDGVINLDKDRTIIGNPTPKFTGGWNNQFTYKNWDMSLFVNFSYGNDIYNANKVEFTNGYTGNSNMIDMMAGRWKVVTATGQTAQWVNSGGKVVGIAPDQLSALNANASIWQPIKGTGAFYPSSWAIEDGSFLRINNLTLGYSVPVEKLSKLKISKLRFYFTANNLAVFTKYTGYDPEVSVKNSPLTPGLDYSAYPKSRSFIFGVNASF
ncbi:MAG: SusC/RagA family protein [Chitinophagaceae bacterium BSSC1]|nr:MAG: SusC/RagA family protein [Chitinophagaceae bacterium BSSC1]